MGLVEGSWRHLKLPSYCLKNRICVLWGGKCVSFCILCHHTIQNSLNLTDFGNQNDLNQVKSGSDRHGVSVGSCWKATKTSKTTSILFEIYLLFLCYHTSHITDINQVKIRSDRHEVRVGSCWRVIETSQTSSILFEKYNLCPLNW